MPPEFKLFIPSAPSGTASRAGRKAVSATESIQASVEEEHVEVLAFDDAALDEDKNNGDAAKHENEEDGDNDIDIHGTATRMATSMLAITIDMDEAAEGGDGDRADDNGCVVADADGDDGDRCAS